MRWYQPSFVHFKLAPKLTIQIRLMFTGLICCVCVSVASIYYRAIFAVLGRRIDYRDGWLGLCPWQKEANCSWQLRNLSHFHQWKYNVSDKNVLFEAEWSNHFWVVKLGGLTIHTGAWRFSRLWGWFNMRRIPPYSQLLLTGSFWSRNELRYMYREIHLQTLNWSPMTTWVQYLSFVLWINCLNSFQNEIAGRFLSSG